MDLSQEQQVMDRNIRREHIPVSPTVGNKASEAAEVSKALAATGRFYSGQVAVSASGGVVTLRGRVSSYYQKQVAQTAAISVVGAGRLRNEVSVVGRSANQSLFPGQTTTMGHAEL